jgi:hypothetical protein
LAKVFLQYIITKIQLYCLVWRAERGYADVVAAGEFVERSRLCAASGGLFLLILISSRRSTQPSTGAEIAAIGEYFWVCTRER